MSSLAKLGAGEVAIEGECDAAFARVTEAFADNFRKHGDWGAAVTVYRDGKKVVDLWGGFASADRSRPWQENDIACTASVGKRVTAMCLLRLIEEGRVELDAPIARYWPAFAAAGKEKIPVRWALSHQAGVPAIRKRLKPESLFDWDQLADAIAETAPWWEPGTRHGYHAMTYGIIIGEIIRRVTGKTTGQFLTEDMAGPLGAEFFIGVPEEHDHRAAVIKPEPVDAAGIAGGAFADPQSFTALAFTNPARTPEVMNTRAWRAAELPASNGHSTARGVARLYAALARGGELDGVRLLKAETIKAACVEQAAGTDAVIHMPSRFGLGFSLPGGVGGAYGPNPAAFGHPGRGGAMGFADPGAGIGFGYVLNQFQAGPDQRVGSVVEALYQCVG